MESNPSAANFQPVAPVRPVAPYIGGKRNLARRLVGLIGETPHSLYAEVFVGMLRFQITSRANFEKLMRQDPSSLTDLQRSARFLYLQRTAFGGKVAGRNFGVSYDAPARFDVTRLQPMLEAVHERLAAVIVERLPWSEFVARYDRPGALFYLDPPYYGSEGDYGAGLFDRGQFELMAEQLRGISGRFILSLTDHPDVRRIFAGFKAREEDVTYTLSSNNGHSAGELIITGP